jgi:hypothetical protein
MRALTKRGTRLRLPQNVSGLVDRYVSVVGEIASVAVETDDDPAKVDHVWINVRAGEFGRVQLSLSTASRQSRAAGFDPRVRVGVIPSVWTELPPSGVRVTAPLDYGLLEAAHPVVYTPFERAAIERLLLEKARRAIFVEAWGEFYSRSHIGIHQIHSRRASYAVPRDIIGKDGAIRFYFREANASEMLLFKYDGQP